MSILVDKYVIQYQVADGGQWHDWKEYDGAKGAVDPAHEVQRLARQFYAHSWRLLRRQVTEWEVVAADQVEGVFPA